MRREAHVPSDETLPTSACLVINRVSLGLCTSASGEGDTSYRVSDFRIRHVDYDQQTRTLPDRAVHRNQLTGLNV